MSPLNPRITKDSMGVFWLSWTPDLSADGYAFTTPSGSSRTFAPAQSKAKLGNPQEPFTVTIKALDITARAGETASYPEVTPPPPPPTGTVPHKGISLGSKVLTRTAADRDYELDRCKDLGAKIIRIDAYGAGTEDATIDAILARGMEVFLCLYGVTGPRSPSEAQAWATAQATRYKGKCSRWEFCNEPDLHGWTPEQYTACLKPVYGALKAVDPANVVVAGALWKWDGGPTPNAAEGVRGWVRRMYAAGAKDFFDVLSLHLYDNPLNAGSWNLWTQAFDLNPSVRSIMADNGDGTKPIISTESGGPVPKYSEDEQAAIVTAIYADKRVDSVFFYTVMDDATTGFGLLRPDRSQRLAYAAFKAAV